MLNQKVNQKVDATAEKRCTFRCTNPLQLSPITVILPTQQHPILLKTFTPIFEIRPTNQKVGSSNPPGRTIFLNNLRSTQFAGICRVSVNCPCSDATAMDSLGIPRQIRRLRLGHSGNSQQPREFTPADHSSSSGGLCPLLPASIIFGGRGISTMITFPRNCEVSSALATWPSTRSNISFTSVSLFAIARFTMASIRSCAYCLPFLSLRARKSSRGCVSFFGLPPGLPLCPGLKMCALNSAESQVWALFDSLI
jgi:hypothetical protein